MGDPNKKRHSPPAHLQGKTPDESTTVLTQVVSPQDANIFGTLHGGRLLHWMDTAAAIAAMKHAGTLCVTVGVDHVHFREPVAVGNLVHIRAHLTRAFTTSMEVKVEVYCEDVIKSIRKHTTTAYYTFVAVDREGNRLPVPPLHPQTDQDREEWQKALLRRQFRLVLAGKLPLPDDLKTLLGGLPAADTPWGGTNTQE